MIASVSTFQDMNEINISLILEGVFHVCLVTSLFTTTSLFCLSLLILAIILVCSFALLLILYVASSAFVYVFLWSATSPPSNSSATYRAARCIIIRTHLLLISTDGWCCNRINCDNWWTFLLNLTTAYVITCACTAMYNTHTIIDRCLFFFIR